MKKSNLRYLTTSLAAASLLASSQSYALGIGDMKLQSALNQNLRAEIGLILSDGESANDFKVNLAPSAKFDEAGIPWTLFLSKIKFKIVPKNGKTVIELSSADVLKEPFLDFLIEVKSAKGSLYREFTVLVDPPAAYQTPIAAPISSEQLRFINAPLNDSSEISAAYITRENDTLWNIAAQYNKQNNVSINRMLAAILIANSDAFQHDKAHTMIVGKTLKIPSFVESPELFNAAKKHETKKIVKKVEAVKRHPAKPKEVKTAAIPVANPLASVESKSIVPKSKDVKKETDKNLPVDALQRLIELEKQLAAMQKAIADKELEVTALKAGKVVPVSVPPVAVIPTQTPVKPAVVAASTSTPFSVQPVVVAPTPVPVSAPPVVAVPAPAPAVVQPVVVAPTSTQVTQPIQSAQPLAVLPPPALPTPVAAVVPPVTSAPIVSPVAVPIISPLAQTPVSESYFGVIPAADLYYYVAGGVGSLLLSVLGWLRLRERNKAKKSVSVDDIKEDSNVFETSDSEQVDTQTPKVADSIDTMFGDMFDDMSESDFEEASAEFADMVNNDSDRHSLDDILYKADVYCTYGNTEQAEKLLYDEFLKNNDAHDYALRLLKLYQDQDSKVEFKEFVFELAKLGKKDLPDFWKKVSDMASVFNPEALLFAPDSNPISTNEILADENLNMKFVDDLNFNSMTFDDPDNKEITFGELTVEESLGSVISNDFFASSLDETELAFELDIMKKEDVTDNLSGFVLEDSVETDATTLDDLNFGGFGFTESLETETELPKAEEPALDFGFGFGFTESLETETELPKTEEPALDLDFAGFGFTESLETEAELPKAEESALDLDFAGFGFTESLETETELPKAEESALDLDFAGFGFAESLKNETELPKAEESALDLDFAGFGFTESLENETEPPKAEESALDLDFVGFGFTESLENGTELPKAEESALDLDFAGFGFTESLETETELPKAEESVLDLDFSGFTVAESMDALNFDKDETPDETLTKTESEEFDANELALDLAIQNFTFDEPEASLAMQKPFAESESVHTKTMLNFDTVNELNDLNNLVDSRINQTYLKLTKVHATEDVQVEYLDMSDSEFADSLANDVLKKCQIKEQLCRQKIIQEVLSKLS